MLDFPPPPPRRPRPRTSWLKLGALGCGGLVLLMVAFGVVGQLLFRGHDVAASAQQAADEGAAAGAKTDQHGCIGAAEAYLRRVGAITHAYEGGTYASACLQEARATPGFCDGVPRVNTLTSSTWRESKCRTGPNPIETVTCMEVMERVQRYCAEPDSIRHPSVDTAEWDDGPAADSASAAEEADLAPRGRH